MKEPKTLQQAILYFADPENCVSYLVARRWPDGVSCPTCGRTDVAYVPVRRVWQCKTRHPKCQFSVKVGTIFEDSPISLDKWLMAMWMLANCKNGVSSWEMHRTLGITQKSAWFMLQRLRLALKTGDFAAKMGSNEGGAVEVDESFVGGKPRNMHYSRKLKLEKIRSEVPAWKNTKRYATKTPVMGMFDRESRQVRAKVVPNVRRETLQAEILNHIEHGSTLYTDQAVAYDSLREQYVHETVNHATEYVRDQVHTNCLENFWSLMKRNLAGTYVCVEPFHLDRHLDEQMFRFNNRATKDNPLNDTDRFLLALSQVANKRLTYAELTGKTATTQA